jgi:branched-chain amino acid transport system ATP-binding protein
MSEALLSLWSGSVRFGGLWAVKEVDMHVRSGEIVGIIGPNGAGKSTLLNVLTGLQRPTQGELQIGAERFSAPTAWRLTQLGIGRSFQTVRLLQDMNVLDNVLIGSHLYSVRGFWHIVGQTLRFRESERKLKQEAMEILEWLGVADKAEETIGKLSLQERRRVEITRALLTRPRVFLLDEPCAGLSPQESSSFSEVLLGIRKRGISIVLVEHNVKMVMSLADRVIVLDHGQKIAEGTPQEVSNNQTVIDAYLGGELHD